MYVSSFRVMLCRCVCKKSMYVAVCYTFIHTHIHTCTYTYWEAQIKIFALSTMYTYALDIILAIGAIVLCE